MDGIGIIYVSRRLSIRTKILVVDCQSFDEPQSSIKNGDRKVLHVALKGLSGTKEAKACSQHEAEIHMAMLRGEPMGKRGRQ